MEELGSLCRTCGKKIHKHSATELFEEYNYPLINLIEDITELWIEYDNKLPEYICHKCKVFLDQIIIFRANCIKTHNELVVTKKKMLQNAKQNFSFHSSGALSISQLEELRQYDDDNNYYDESWETVDKTNQTVQQAAKVVENVREADNKKQAKKAYPKVKKTWICEQCGGVFRCSTYLKLHLLRHTGKKDFECEVCHGKFYTRNEMQRHRILHTLARPFACKYCGKTFRGGSSKAVHERTHTNERPFACQYCEKRFTSTSVCRSHELTHAGKRRYHCEICDQWFLRSSHLSIHQRTKQHKKKAEIANNT